MRPRIADNSKAPGAEGGVSHPRVALSNESEDKLLGAPRSDRESIEEALDLTHIDNLAIESTLSLT